MAIDDRGPLSGLVVRTGNRPSPPFRTARDLLVGLGATGASGPDPEMEVQLGHRRTVVGIDVEHAHPNLDERRLAALGGLAVAIGDPGRQALPPPPGCLHNLVGVHAAAAALAGLLTDTTEITVRELDVVASQVFTNATLYWQAGLPWFRAGPRANGSGGCYPYGLFSVADGHVCLIGRTRRDWEAIVEAAGSPAWSRDPRFTDLVAMGREYPQEVDALLAPWLSSMTRSELVSAARRHGFPAGPVRRPDEVPSMPDDMPFTVSPLSGGRGLAGLKGALVVDLSWVWSGPAVGAALADLGADVVKVESARRPDNTRLRPTAGRRRDDPDALEASPYFHVLNRGKRSLGLDLTSTDGRQVLTQLVAQADVLVENLSPGVMERFGVGPREVASSNPDCVYLSLRGYEGEADLSGLRAYAPVLSSAAGIESLVRYGDEDPVGMMNFGLSDAVSAALGTLLALAGLCRRATGQGGMRATLSQYRAAVLANATNLAGATEGGVPQAAPLEPSREPDVVRAEDLESTSATSPDLFTAVPHEVLGEVRLPRLPWRLDGRMPPVSAAGPRLGADTEQVLTDVVGLAPDHISGLAGRGVLR